MADLSKKTRYCFITIRKLSYPSNMDELLKNYCETFCKRYTYIKHEGDVNLENAVEDTHYHCVLEFKENQRMSTRLNCLCDYFGFENAFGIDIDRIKSNVKCIQYLTHQNDKVKTQHSADEIICNYDREELRLILESEQDDVTTFDYLISVLMEETNILGVIQRLGLNQYKTYRNVIWDMINGMAYLQAKYKLFAKPVTSLDK